MGILASLDLGESNSSITKVPLILQV